MTFTAESQPRPVPRGRYRSGSGVSAVFTEGAALSRLDVGAESVLLYPSDDLEAGPANLYLRLHLTTGIVVTPLLGPASPAGVVWAPEGPLVRGRWHGLGFRVQFRLSEHEPAWFWHVAVTNPGAEPVTVDVVHTQDVALAPYQAVRTNEFYVAQYLDVTPVETRAHGPVLAVRQNMPGDRVPWLALGCLRETVGWGTDALQLLGRAATRGATPPALLVARLPSTRLQHEHTLAMLQDRAAVLAPGQSLTTGFFGIYRPDHPAATTPADSGIAERALALPEAAPPVAVTAPDDDDAARAVPIVTSLFSSAPPLRVAPLDEQKLTRVAGPGHHEVERSGDELFSYFTDDGTHVVTAAKEREVLRPHGHILRTGTTLVPDGSSLTSTAWMAGIFASQVTQGHASRDPVLSVRRGYLGQRGAFGLRIFVAPSGVAAGGTPSWALLDQPSAWALTPDSCRWWYQHEHGLLEVTVLAAAHSHELRLSLRVLSGDPVRALVCAHVAFGGDDGAATAPPVLAADAAGVTVRVPGGSPLADRVPRASFRLAWTPDAISSVAGDAPLFHDRLSRDLPWVTLTAGPTMRLELSLTADVATGPRPVDEGPVEPGADFWSGISTAIQLHAPDGGHWSAEVERLNAVMPWFAHDALIHYLAPRGLEQYTGGAWGTRDACQGPVGLLLALGQTAPLRDLVLRVLAAQNTRGDWPQWFEFWADTPRTARTGAHGDVVFWPLLAVGEYLATTGDTTLLDELVPFVGEAGASAPEPVLEHLRRALAHITASTVPGSPLPAYGHGDWNDSLQPVDPALAARLCSTWTVTLEVHALRTIAGALRGTHPARTSREPAAEPAAAGQASIAGFADDAADLAERAAVALDRVLVRDGLLCGYGLFGADGTVEHLVHPSDASTGLHHSVLPMIHAISGDLLGPESARTHLAALDEHLLGPDGARLFDRPARYQGGPMETFQRAEAATFFGREIGIMYTHAHLRYAEALARHGDAEALLLALMLANPIGLTARVPSAAVRQSTCFYSSSDAAFTDRYDAERNYARIGSGEVALEGGWRVYSSGPGLFLRLVVEQLLGVRRRGGTLELDPVLPPSLDGLTASVQLDGHTLHLTYSLGGTGVGPTSVTLDGSPLPLTALTNPYRDPGVAVPLAEVLDALRRGRGALHVTTG